jgi:hypothetical protein
VPRSSGQWGIHSLIFGFVLAWRAYGLAARDFAPKAFTVTPPIDLHRGLSGLSDLAGGLLVGSSLVAAGVLLMARPRRPPAWLAIGLGGIVMVASVGRNWIDFLRDDVTAKQIDWDGHTAAFGIRLGEVLPPTTTVAVVAAGAIPFFSNLPSVDLLGKSDAHIAREEPLERFVPGHDKRDYAYSLSTYKPDLVLELWHHAPEELRAIAAQGYRRLPNGMYVREECPDELLYLIEHGLPEYPYGVHKSK